MKVTNEELETRFTYHAPKEGQSEKYQKLRNWAKELAHHIVNEVPDSREQALALTKLEEAIMWVNAGIARRSGGSAVQRTSKEVYVIFDGPAGPEAGRFVELEDADGRSVGGGKAKWKERNDGYWEFGPLLLEEKN